MTSCAKTSRLTTCSRRAFVTSRRRRILAAGLNAADSAFSPHCRNHFEPYGNKSIRNSSRSVRRLEISPTPKICTCAPLCRSGITRNSENPSAGPAGDLTDHSSQLQFYSDGSLLLPETVRSLAAILLRAISGFPVSSISNARCNRSFERITRESVEIAIRSTGIVRLMTELGVLSLLS